MTGAPAPPTRAEREACWNARDAIFRCLDAARILDPATPEAQKVCLPERKEFLAQCTAAWANYFQKRRVAEYKKQKQLEFLKKRGAQELPPETLNRIAQASQAAQAESSNDDK